MQAFSATTPFGRGPYTSDQMNAQLDAKNREPGISVEQWKVFDAIKSAKDLICISDRALTQLNALLIFHPVETLASEQPIIVFRSNKKLASRARGFRNGTLINEGRSMQ